MAKSIKFTVRMNEKADGDKIAYLKGKNVSATIKSALGLMMGEQQEDFEKKVLDMLRGRLSELFPFESLKITLKDGRCYILHEDPASNKTGGVLKLSSKMAKNETKARKQEAEITSVQLRLMEPPES